MAVQGMLFPMGVTKCECCGRTLTNPLSVHLGIGPVCRGHRNGGSDMPHGVDGICDFQLANPIEDGVILMRDEQGCHTNVPHLVIHHSPTGFEWGYGGSGPADLSLNILEMMLHRQGYKGERMQCYDGDCFCLAYELHQQFKWDVIGPMDRNGGTIPLEAIEAWMYLNQKGDTNAH